MSLRWDVSWDQDMAKLYINGDLRDMSRPQTAWRTNWTTILRASARDDDGKDVIVEIQLKVGVWSNQQRCLFNGKVVQTW
jgi:hypothetical protein